MFLREGGSLLQQGEAGLQSGGREPAFSWAFGRRHFGPFKVTSNRKVRAIANGKQHF